jgi:hypothetical protein
MSRDVSRIFESPRALLSWANDDLRELEESMVAFYSGDVCKRFTEVEPVTGYTAHKVAIVKPAPENWRRLASHALADIRHSLDQSMLAACSALAPAQITSDVYFPWASHPKDLEARLVSKDYIPEQIYPAVRRLHPYPPGHGYEGGDELIYELRKLAGGNKHRVAIQPSAGVQEYTISGGSRRMVMLHEPWDAEKQEFTAALTEPGSDDDCEIKLKLGVAFSEAGLLQGYSVIQALTFFADYAQFACNHLEAEVRKILKSIRDVSPLA